MPTSTIDRQPVPAETVPEQSPLPRLLVPADVRLYVDLDDFERLCAVNDDVRLERDADGGLIVISPAFSDTSRRNNLLSGRLLIWNEAARLGVAFDSSGGFTFPDGSVLSPDASWVRLDRWRAAAPEDRDGFARVVPDFAAELRSQSDSLVETRAKMQAYRARGVRLGWLIDPKTKTVEVYRPGREPETLTNPSTLSGEDVLPGFTLDLTDILT